MSGAVAPPPTDGGTTGRMPAWLLAAVALAAIRPALLGLLHRAPARYAEANDLGRLAYNHALLRGLLFDWGPVAGVPEAEHYPPLYYVGLPAALSWARELTLPVVLGLNGLCLAGAAVAVWKTTRALGGPSAGVWATAVLLCLPGVAGQVTIAGAEPALLFAFAVYLAGLVHLVNRWDPRGALVGGLALGGGLLVKWSLVLSACVPGAVVALLALTGAPSGPADRGGRSRRFSAVLAIPLAGALVLLPWLLLSADRQALVQSASMEPTGTGLASFALPFGWMLSLGLGPFGAALAALAVVLGATRSPRVGHPALVLLLASALAVPLLHALVPHKELRYLLPGYVPIVVLVGWSLGGVRGLARSTGVALLACLFVGTWVAPWLSAPREYRPDAQLRLAADTDDLGLRAVVCHPVFVRTGGGRVLLVPGGGTPLVYRSILDWELAQCSGHETVVHDFAMVLDPSASPQLLTSTHVLLTRDPLGFEEAILKAHGFEAADSLPTRLERLPTVHLWRRRDDREPAPERLAAIMRRLASGPPVSGIVLDPRSEQPLSATVEVPRSEPEVQVETDDAGRFEIEPPLSLGVISLLGEAPDRVASHWIQSHDDARPVRIPLWRRSELEALHREEFEAPWDPTLASVVIELESDSAAEVAVALGQSYDAVFAETRRGAYRPGSTLYVEPGELARVWFVHVIPSPALPVDVMTPPGLACEGPPAADVAADTLVTVRLRCSARD